MRNQAFLQIQNGISLIIEFINNAYGQYKPEIIEKIPDSLEGTQIHENLLESSDIFQVMKNVSDADLPLIMNHIMSIPIVKEKGDQLNLNIIDPFAYSMILPYVNNTVQLIKDHPLYQDILISSVSAFEIYLRDTLHDLIINNGVIAKVFEEEVKGMLNIDEDLDYHRSTKQLIAHVLTQRLSYFNTRKIEHILRKCFSKPGSEPFVIHPSAKRKQDLHYYLRLRNLLVHNGGSVDQKFLKETKCEYGVGEQHPVTEANVSELIGLVWGIVDRIEEEIKNY